MAHLQFRLRTLFIVTTVMALFAFCCSGFWSLIQNRLVVINESDQEIKWLEVTTGGDTIRFENIAAAAQVTRRFRIRGDDSIKVQGELEDGTEIGPRSLGYFTNGMSGVRATIRIDQAGELRLE